MTLDRFARNRAVAQRRSSPDDETNQTWLPLLLKATAIVDAGVSEGIRREQAQGRALPCRQFNVIGQVCVEGEDAWYTRRADVFMPLREYADAAFDTMLPFYGVAKSAECAADRKRRGAPAREGLAGIRLAETR